jgi:hypothetical protein
MSKVINLANRDEYKRHVLKKVNKMVEDPEVHHILTLGTKSIHDMRVGLIEALTRVNELCESVFDDEDDEDDTE